MDFMNIFENDAFSLASMTSAIERVPTNPGTLGQLNLFNTHPIRNVTVGIEERKGSLSLIKTSQRGAPLEQGTGNKAKLRYFGTSRVAKQDVILASELQFVRQFDTIDSTKQLQSELAMRMGGADGLLADVQYTKENMRLGAIQGKFLDADGTVLYDYFTEFGITQATEIGFSLATAADGALRESIQVKVLRPMRRLAQGARYSGVKALCSASFFDALLKNPEVRASYEGISEQVWLRTSYDGQAFDFGGIEWIEYVGDDLNAEVKVADDKCVFIPTGVGNSVFEAIYSPAESFDDIGTLGREVYAYTTPDLKHNRFVELEVASYPLFLCKRPDLLFSGRLGA